MTKTRTTDSKPETRVEAWAEAWAETDFHLITISRTVSMIETRTDIPIEIRISIQIEQQVLGFTQIEIRLGIGNDVVGKKSWKKTCFSVFFFLKFCAEKHTSFIDLLTSS